MDVCLVAQSFSWLDPASWLGIFKMALGLGFVIFVHELGHFGVAKMCGVKCEKFYVGFDFWELKIGNTVIIPKRFFKFQWGETEYGVGSIPLGGYVKMLGQVDDPREEIEERERAIAEGRVDDAGKVIHDPRHYRSKSVPQRMAIISAGVIMNLIFAVIFAAIAYSLGATYKPCEIGTVLPGSPAYIADIRPGDKVVQIGEVRRDHLRFDFDLRQSIALNGPYRDMKLVLQREGQDEEIELMIRPDKDFMPQKKSSIATLGITETSIPTIPLKDFVIPGRAAARVESGQTAFEGGDSIVGLKTVDADGNVIDQVEFSSIYPMKKFLRKHSAEDVIFVVKRHESTDTAEIRVGTNPLRMFGMQMEYGAVRAIRANSPAAGVFENGDVIEKIKFPNLTTNESENSPKAPENEFVPIGNIMMLSHDLRMFIGKEVEFLVTRDGAEKTLKVTPQVSNSLTGTLSQLPISIDELGIALEVYHKVKTVVADSPADAGGILPGDEILKFKAIASSKENEKIETETLNLSHEEIDFSEEPLVWPSIFSSMQHFLADTKFEMQVKRGDKIETITLGTAASKSYFADNRGIRLTSLKDVHTAKSFGEAISLGFRQTKEDALRIYGFLGKLFSGQISPVNLGGPGTIAVVTTSEAMRGESRLLLFLTLLSANLAVVNFLPIPVLDGGHMVFLIYELIFRKPINEKIYEVALYMGLFFVLGLMIFVIGLDVWRFVPGL